MNFNKFENLAVQLMDDGKLRRAEHVLRQMLAEDADCVAAHFHLARVYRKTEEYDRALYHARRTLRLNPKEPNACLNLGLIFELMGRDKLAKAYYKRELLRDPNNAVTLWNVGRLYFRTHRWRDASIYLRRCFDTGYEFEMEETIDKLGLCYFKLRELQAYIDVFTAYVKSNPTASWAFANLGRALLESKDYSGAVSYLRQAEQLGVKNSVAVWLAQAEEAQAADGIKR